MNRDNDGFAIERDSDTGKYYEMIRMPDHPFADRHGYVKWHRFLIEVSLGRFLSREEIVHHLDSDSLNNSFDNLQHTSHSEHTYLHHTGSKQSEETKRKISNSLIGKTGKYTRSIEHRQRQRELALRRYRKLE